MEVRKSLRIEHRKSKPLMLLKDYLLDDLSSCSSSGFMSFPRRPRRSSSTSIRLLLDIDLRTGIPSTSKTNKKKSLNRVSSSLFRTAAVKLVNAVKSPLGNTCFLPHDGRAARKLLSSEAKDVPAMGMSRFEGENGIVSEKNYAAAATGERKDCVTDSRDCIGGEATNPCSKEWIMGKEQSSPVSVLDYPFDEDDDAETDPHSKSSPANFLPTREGCRHGALSRIASLDHEEEEEAAQLSDSICLVGEESRQYAQEKDETEAVLERMLKTMKAEIPSYDSKADVLILDFFREKMEEGGGNGYMALWRWDWFEDEAVRMAEKWVRGVEETYLGWEMEKGRMAYLKDMERGKVRWNEMGNYGSHEDSERYEVCLEVEDVVWTLLVYEVLIDIFG